MFSLIFLKETAYVKFFNLNSGGCFFIEKIRTRYRHQGPDSKKEEAPSR